MVKPKWLALLVGALVVVTAFLFLGKWQLESAFESSGTPADAEAYETVTPLGELLEPGAGVVETNVARPMSVSGWLVPGDFEVVANRLQDGEIGWWVVGHLAVAEDGVTDYREQGADDDGEISPYPGLPVALAWAPTEEAARAGLEELDAAVSTPPGTGAGAAPVEFVGKLEAPQDPASNRGADDPYQLQAMAPGQLINTWERPAVAYYSAWAVIEEGTALPAGLEAIRTVDIDQSFQLDMLNIFYAIEWAIFAVMALYIWWRLVRDDYRAETVETSDEALADDIRREKLRALAERRRTAATHEPAERN